MSVTGYLRVLLQIIRNTLTLAIELPTGALHVKQQMGLEHFLELKMGRIVHHCSLRPSLGHQ